MRQIKFRAWHTKDKCYCERVSCGAMSIVGYDVNEIFNNDIVFEQFTGLLDKDGVEIYEGDILENINMKYKEHKNAVVEWAGHRYILRCLCGVVFNHGFENISISEIKVIGNIREEQK